MSNRTIVLSLPTSDFNNNNRIVDHLFNEFVKACETAGIVIRYEPYDRDIYNELNLEALDIERNHTLTQLEEEILNNSACINGTCED